MREVYSSVVAGIDYEDGMLVVEWTKPKKNGSRRTIYGSTEAPIPEKLASEVMNAPSVNTALRTMIEGAYTHRDG